MNTEPNIDNAPTDVETFQNSREKFIALAREDLAHLTGLKKSNDDVERFTQGIAE